MKILYSIQGTGNGHITRARDLVPALKKVAETDVMISGIQADIDLGLDVDFRMHGMGFMFGKNGKVDFVKTFRKCITRKFIQEVRELPVADYDLIINDFEPVSAWAARLRGIPCVSLSHQYAVMHFNAPRPEKKDWLGQLILSHYAPVQKGFGFHFQSYADGIFTPVIRQEVREVRKSKGEHVCVYLPSYDDERILKVLGEISGVDWQVFSKHCKKEFRKGSVWVRPIENQAFLKCMAASRAVLCGAGFETPAEALFLGKNLLVIPMKNQYEQHCNAAALEQMGVKCIKSLKRKHIPLMEDWLNNGLQIQVNYPDCTREIVQTVIQEAIKIPKPRPLTALSIF